MGLKFIMRQLSAALLFVVLIVAAFVGYRIYRDYAQSEECIEDVLHLIRQVKDMRDEKGTDSLEQMYRVQQHAIDARRLLSPWMTDPQPDRRRIAKAADGALTELERASKLFLEISRGHGTEEELAEFKVKLDSGRWRLFDISAAIHKHPPPLTAVNKRHLIRYIDNVFGEELAAQKQKLKDDPKANGYQELYAIELIRNDLQPAPKPLKELF